jgi:uncharacterized protein YhbP (UPF0306 family)
MEAYEDLFRISSMTLATGGPDGEPHAAAVYFAAVKDTWSEAGAGWRLYFFSELKSQHAQDIERDQRAAAALYPECQGWQDIRGLQMRGVVKQVLPGDEWERGWEAYRLKFPFVSQLKVVVARNKLYAFLPGWLRLVDNRQGFGFKREWVF